MNQSLNNGASTNQARSTFQTNGHKHVRMVAFSFAEVLASVWHAKSRAIIYTAGSLGWEHRTFAQLRMAWGKPLHVVIAELWPQQRYKEFMRTYVTLNDLFPVKDIGNAVGVVRELRLRGFRTALITSSDRQVVSTNLSQIGMSLSAFDVVQTLENSPFLKPDQRVFDPLVVLAHDVGIDREEILYVGDTAADLKLAETAHLPVAGVLSGGATADDFAAQVPHSIVINNITSLPQLLGHA